ncbi:MAG: ligand-binding SRPBCC domain-containing protein [Candidatus Binatia bacterium]|jgi:ligand-binding SRPBCC domain-containing protein
MTTFEHSFIVDAPLAKVRNFHADTSALKQLTPPPMIAQMHTIEPLAEGSISEFTLWLGPIPIRWRAVHRDVTANQFTDVQDAGPAKSWAHTHRFVDLGDDRTRVDDHIEYELHPSFKGFLTLFLFSKVGLRGLFFWRMVATRRGCRVK